MGGFISGIGKTLFGESGQKPQAFRGYGYQDQGKLLNDLLLGQAQTIGSQAAPELSFGSQYNPYQFTNSFNASTAVQDAFTPQAANLQRIFNQRQADNAGAINTDLERRGLSTSGAANYALGQNRQQTQDALSNALAQLAGTQANSQLQASQFGAQMDFNKQLNQAAELFRNRGASDQQALQMAQYAMQRQQQPIQNLMSLYGLSAGATPGYEASPGLVQSAAGGFGQGLGSLAGFGLFA